MQVKILASVRHSVPHLHIVAWMLPALVDHMQINRYIYIVYAYMTHADPGLFTAIE